MFRSVISVAVFLTGALIALPVSADDALSSAIKTIAGVKAGQGAGDEIKAALATVEAAGAKALVPVASQIGRGTAVTDNWLRGAFEAAAASGIEDVRGDLVAFFRDRTNSPRARRLVYETLIANYPEAKDELLADAINDPSEEMRVDAVNRLVAAAEKETDEAVKLEVLSAALKAATVKEQVDRVSKEVKALGGAFDEAGHYGYLTTWKAVGPFDNKDMKGFDVLYGPEKGDLSAPDLGAVFEGTLGEAKWTDVSASGDDGVIDLAEQLGPHKGVLVYVTTSFESDRDRSVEIRLSTANAWKMWLNGQPLFEREEYHRGMLWDQYRVPATLTKGTNVLVMKVLQNEQDQSWAQRWSYRVRLTDPTGFGLGDVAGR